MADSTTMLSNPDNQDVNVKKKLTGAERIRRYREKKSKEDPDFKKKESQRVEQLRKKRVASMNPQELQKARQKSKESTCKWRQKKESTSEDAVYTLNGQGFKSPQALGKAIRRLKNNLPKSPSKKYQAISGFAQQVGIQLQQKMKANLKPAHSLTDEEENVIKNFYFEPDVEYTMPGLKDEKTVWVKGEKQKLRKYYLIMYLKEAFQLFKLAHPEIKIGFSKFASLRPVNVLLLKDQPSDQCKCRLHENFSLKLKGLNTTYTDDFWSKHLCGHDEYDNICWKGECEKCCAGKLFSEFCKAKPKEDEVIWKQWEKIDAGRMSLQTHTGCRGELEDAVISSWTQFQEHIRVKRIQAGAFQRDKNDPESSVLQCDFAMAYSCEYQNEIQTALWSRQSVNLFTAAFYLKNKPCQSYLIVTDSNDKGKNTVFCFLTKLIAHYGQNDFGNYLSIYTDGPSSEFKNKYWVEMLKQLSTMTGVEMRWQYFATSHGKGVVDGIGGSAKAAVRRNVMSKGKNLVVQNADDFASLVKQLLPAVKVILVKQTDIDEFAKASCHWENVDDCPGISKVHTVWCKNGTLKLCNTDFDFQSHNASGGVTVTGQENAVNTGDWVVVVYDQKKFPGEVVKVGMEDIQVSVMHRTFNSNWKWPEKTDSVYYMPSDIVKKISPPEPVGSRGQFHFSDNIDTE